MSSVLYEMCVQSEQNTVLIVSKPEWQSNVLFLSTIPYRRHLGCVCNEFLGKVMNMIRTKNGICGFYMQMLLLVSISERLYCELKVRIRRIQEEIPVRVKRFTATHSVRCFLKCRFVYLLHSLNIMLYIACNMYCIIALIVFICILCYLVSFILLR